MLQHKSTQVLLNKDTLYSIQPVPAVFHGYTSLQRLQVITPDNQHELIVQTELQNGRIDMVGFSQSGMQLFHLNWQPNQALAVTRNIALADLPAEQLLAYYQLSNWPLNDIQKGLKGMQIQIKQGEHETREFFIKNQLIFSLVKNNLGSTLTHYQDNYTINIQNLD